MKIVKLFKSTFFDANGNTVFCVKLRIFFSWVSIADFTMALTFLIKFYRILPVAASVNTSLVKKTF